MNLLLSLEATTDVPGTSSLRKVCVAAQEPRNQSMQEGNVGQEVANPPLGLLNPDEAVRDPGNGHNAGVRFYSIGTVSDGGIDENEELRGSGVRRRLFGEACDKGK